MRVDTAARKDEASITIAAIDMAALIDFQPDARMAKRSTVWNVAGAIAGDPAGRNSHCFGLVDHGRGISNRRCGAQPDQK